MSPSLRDPFLGTILGVEAIPTLDGQALGLTAHRDRELVEETSLAEEDGPGRSPLTHEPDLGVPFDVCVIRIARSVELEREIDESGRDRVTTDTELKCPRARIEIDPYGLGEPRRSKNVLRARIDQGHHRRARLVRYETHGHHGPQNYRVDRSLVLLVRVKPREGRPIA